MSHQGFGFFRWALAFLVFGVLLPWGCYWVFKISMSQPFDMGSVVSPDRELIADLHVLSGNSDFPYAKAVRLRRNSGLAPFFAPDYFFVANCRDKATLTWRTSKQLEIDCPLGHKSITPLKQSPAPFDVIVVHSQKD